MTNRQFNAASFVSGVLAGFSIILWLATFIVSPENYRLSFTHHFHVSVWSGFTGDTLGRLVVFTDTQGPYAGGMLGVAGKEIQSGWHTTDYKYDFGQTIFLSERAEIEDTEQYCDLPGIYFRHFVLPSQPPPSWTLMISLWYPLCLFSILPLLCFLRRWRVRRISRMTIA
jgi:hypothetical protein